MNSVDAHTSSDPRLRILFSVLACIVLALLPLVGSPLGLTDFETHAPPVSGRYAYNAFRPATLGFPARGRTYVDPVFGTTIRRITDSFPKLPESPIYSKNGWWNADGKRFTHKINGQMVAVDSTTGAVVVSLPNGDLTDDDSFDPVNPNIWYYFSGSSIRQFNIVTRSDTLVKTFPATLQSPGDSVDWMDNAGSIWVVLYGGAAHVWNKQTDTIYPGSVDTSAVHGVSGWIGITPSGRYVTTAISNKHTSYAINHTTQTLSSSGTLYWTLCGGHGDLMTASDQKDYLIISECYSEGAYYRVDVSLPQRGDTDAGRQQQRDQNTKLLQTGFWRGDTHISGASKGQYKDWAYFAVEYYDDTFTDPGTWVPYKQEIIAIQIAPPYTIRRLAHHRSRGIDCPSCIYKGYGTQPRLSVSWDGSKVAWASDFGYDASPAEYSDIYVIETAGAAGRDGANRFALAQLQLQKSSQSLSTDRLRAIWR